jgi:hypothetical protein
MQPIPTPVMSSPAAPEVADDHDVVSLPNLSLAEASGVESKTGRLSMS